MPVELFLFAVAKMNHFEVFDMLTRDFVLPRLSTYDFYDATKELLYELRQCGVCLCQEFSSQELKKLILPLSVHFCEWKTTFSYQHPIFGNSLTQN